jgi:K+-transporting ATPase ATPase C chain
VARSAASELPHYAGAPASSNLAPSNPALAQAVQARLAALRRADPENQQPIPADLVTASSSGLDPHISLAAALCQAPRVARARGLSTSQVEALVWQFAQGRQLGLLGEPRFLC